MKDFKGTPGPWVVDGAGVGAEFNIDSADGGTSVGITSQIFRDKDHEIRTANANLIAAAPELLEALQWAMTKIGGYTQRTKTNIDYCDDVDRARAAIARALGEKK